MSNNEQHTPGIWDDEPDELNWEHAGVACHLSRCKPSGHLCGYVGVPASHPYHGKHYDDKVHFENIEEKKIDIEKVGIMTAFCASIHADVDNDLLSISLILEAHGGITFADKIKDLDETKWWFGFDCAHNGDLSPYYSGSFRQGTYRDIEYVKAETNRLAEQLAAVSMEGVKQFTGESNE